MRKMQGLSVLSWQLAAQPASYQKYHLGQTQAYIALCPSMKEFLPLKYLPLQLSEVGLGRKLPTVVPDDYLKRNYTWIQRDGTSVVSQGKIIYWCFKHSFVRDNIYIRYGYPLVNDYCLLLKDITGVWSTNLSVQSQCSHFGKLWSASRAAGPWTSQYLMRPWNCS